MSEILKAPDSKKTSLEVRRTFWRRVIDLYEASDSMPSAFCKGHEINAGQIYRWQRIFKRDHAPDPEKKVRDTSSQTPALFAQVTTSPSISQSARASSLIINIRNKYSIEVNTDTDLHLLQSIVEVMSR